MIDCLKIKQTQYISNNKHSTCLSDRVDKIQSVQNLLKYNTNTSGNKLIVIRTGY